MDTESSSQFSVLSSQFSVLSSQFSVLSSQFSVLSERLALADHTVNLIPYFVFRQREDVEAGDLFEVLRIGGD
jgi:hypothetical protein